MIADNVKREIYGNIECKQKNCRLTRAHENSPSSVNTRRIDVKFAAIGTTKMKTVKSRKNGNNFFDIWSLFAYTLTYKPVPFRGRQLLASFSI